MHKTFNSTYNCNSSALNKLFTLLIAAIKSQGNDGKPFYLLTETFSSKK